MSYPEVDSTGARPIAPDAFAQWVALQLAESQTIAQELCRELFRIAALLPVECQDLRVALQGLVQFEDRTRQLLLPLQQLGDAIDSHLPQAERAALEKAVFDLYTSESQRVHHRRIFGSECCEGEPEAQPIIELF